MCLLSGVHGGFQMRSVSGQVSGRWSEPIAIPVDLATASMYVCMCVHMWKNTLLLDDCGLNKTFPVDVNACICLC